MQNILTMNTEQENSNLHLVFVEPIGLNSHDMFEYDFLFSETPKIVWADDWAEQCPRACDNMRPEGEMITDIKRLATIIPFGLAQQNTCFSMQDCIDGIIALAWEDLSEYEEYPEPIRLIFNFGESFDSVEDKLAQRSQFFSKRNVKPDTNEKTEV